MLYFWRYDIIKSLHFFRTSGITWEFKVFILCKTIRNWLCEIICCIRLSSPKIWTEKLLSVMIARHWISSSSSSSSSSLITGTLLLSVGCYDLKSFFTPSIVNLILIVLIDRLWSLVESYVLELTISLHSICLMVYR